MQQMKIYVFGGWDTPVCYNDMYMLDLGKPHSWVLLEMYAKALHLFVRTNETQ